ncbi:MAG: NUDIX hydrolase [Clostridia bacterium]|nr:NUDIX hydrolase [Clostridia bacterium]
MRALRRQIEAYRPCNEQEAQDKALLLRAIDTLESPLTRENPFAHFTASAWIVNPSRDRALMAWHNIYRTWAWTGGHADGEADLLAVALREAREETGIAAIAPVRPDIYSIEVLPVNSHVKRGRFVSAHLHLNVTYLLEADDAQPVRAKPDENSAVAWLPLREAADNKEEPFMAVIYRKLNEKIARF